MAYAQWSDVAARLGRPIGATEQDLVRVLLDDVEATIVRRIPDLDQRLGAVPPTINEAAVVKAESWAVIRYLRNPDGKTQESIDDYSFTRDRALASGALSLTDEEWEEILPAASSTAFSISPSYRADHGPT